MCGEAIAFTLHIPYYRKFRLSSQVNSSVYSFLAGNCCHPLCHGNQYAGNEIMHELNCILAILYKKMYYLCGIVHEK